MTTEEATYVIAHQEGLDLTRYLDGELVDRVRGLVPSDAVTRSSPNKAVAKKALKPKQVNVSVSGKLPNLEVFLSDSTARDAARMAELYPVYYVLENSIRVVIKRILEKNYGNNWWDTRVHKPIREKVKNRKASEDKKPWHGKRGQHEIFYSDFGDLKAIIEKNWPEFTGLFPTRQWITGKLDDLEHPRNVMAHHNPVSPSDLRRINLYFEDWTKLLASKKNVIP